MKSMDVKSTFGKNLRLYRKAKKLSQGQLSKKVDISVKHLSALERGLAFVSADLLEKLASSVEIPVFCFFVNDKKVIYNEKEVFYSDTMVETMDKIIEKHLSQAISEFALKFPQARPITDT